MRGALTQRDATRLQRAAGSAVGRPLLWGIVVALLAAWPLVWALRSPPPPPPPVLGAVPPFDLTDTAGRPFGSSELAGRVWVASLAFTRCPTICPAVTRHMARVEARTRGLDPAVHLVTFTVDPEHDTPARLAEYARAYRANPRRWTFLTGPTEAVQETVERGLRVSMGREPGAAPGEISHGTHLVLVDGAGRIRGYYDPGEPGSLDRLVRDAALLANRP